MGKVIHRLSNKNIEERTADCAACGHIPIRKRGHSWRCYYGHLYGSKNVPKTKKPSPEICELCQREERIYFDHNHATGAHRGWLCRNCNYMLGHAHDDPELLKRASEYLLR